MAILLSASCINAKTLVVYYSFTNNVHTTLADLPFPAWQGNERQAYRSDCFECQQRYKQCGGRCQTPYPARHFSRA